MFNWLLMVVDNPSSGTNSPDWTVEPEIDFELLIIGIVIGIALTLCIWGIISIIRFIIKYNKNLNNTTQNK